MKNLIAIGALALAAAACNPPSDPGADFCQRADECNYLAAGTSVDECVEIEDRCTGQLSSSQLHDWETMMNDCLELDSCDLFIQCWQQVPWC